MGARRAFCAHARSISRFAPLVWVRYVFFCVLSHTTRPLAALLCGDSRAMGAIRAIWARPLKDPPHNLLFSTGRDSLCALARSAWRATWRFRAERTQKRQVLRGPWTSWVRNVRPRAVSHTTRPFLAPIPIFKLLVGAKCAWSPERARNRAPGLPFRSCTSGFGG